MSKPVVITLSDGNVWKYCLDRQNAYGEVKPYWGWTVQALVWDDHYAESQPEPVAITLSDDSVWEYNAKEKSICAWRCPTLMPDRHYAEPQLGPNLRGISILTAADHRAIADVLDPTTKAEPPHQMNQDHTNAFNTCQVCDKLAPKEIRGQYNERYTYICKPHLQEIIASLAHVNTEKKDALEQENAAASALNVETIIKRTYAGPIIEHAIEFGIADDNASVEHSIDYHLAVNDATGDLLIVHRDHKSYADKSKRPPRCTVSYTMPIGASGIDPRCEAFHVTNEENV